MAFPAMAKERGKKKKKKMDERPRKKRVIGALVLILPSETV